MKNLIVTIVLLLACLLPTRAALVLEDSFNYPDGAIVGAPGSPWLHHSGAISGLADVESGRLFLSESEFEDINAPLAGQPFTVANGGKLYSSFLVSFSKLPSGSGSYFAHFRDALTGFRARIFASTLNAAPGSFRLSIANSSTGNATTAQLPEDLQLGVSYTLVSRYDVGTGLSTLWLNPTSESDPGVNALDPSVPVDITSYAFRQSLDSGDGMGDLFVDNLRIATTFAEVVPEPSTYLLLGIGLGAFAIRGKRIRSLLKAYLSGLFSSQARRL
jgi:hypothetical protein